MRTMAKAVGLLLVVAFVAGVWDARYGQEERHGPYATYQAAHKKWAERAWATVDDAHSRFRIVTEDG